jgi:hypothetical protein
MIRVRNKSGKITYENNDDLFIELYNDDNKVVAVFFERKDNGQITQMMADHPNAQRYEDLFNVKFIKKKVVLEDDIQQH